MKDNTRNRLIEIRDLMLSLQDKLPVWNSKSKHKQVEEFIEPTFCMNYFLPAAMREVSLGTPLDQLPECGTVACALGWSAIYLEPAGSWEDSYDYCSRILDLVGSEGDVLYDWLFVANWSTIAPEPADVAYRINYLLGLSEEGYTNFVKEYDSNEEHVLNLWNRIKEE